MREEDRDAVSDICVRSSSRRKAISNNQRSEMVSLTLPAGKYALIANGTVEGTDRRLSMA